MMKDIKNLIFDFGGVLINLDRTACREAFEKLGIESIHESVLDDYRQKELYMQLESGNISAAAFRASMRRLSDQDLTDQQIDDAWVSILGDIPDYKLDWLLELRKQIPYSFIEQYKQYPLAMVRAEPVPLQRA